MTDITAPEQVPTQPLEEVTPPPEQVEEGPPPPAAVTEEEAPVVPVVPERERGRLARSLDWIADKATAVGVPILRYGGWGISFLSELLGPTTFWIPKVALVGAGYGLDKLGTKHPGSRVCRLAKALGEGVWKGGALGGLTGLVVNAVVPGVGGVPATDVLRREFEGNLRKTVLGAEKIRVWIADGNLGKAAEKAAKFTAEQAKAGVEALGVEKEVEAVGTFVGEQAKVVAGEAGKMGPQFGPQVGEMVKKGVEVIGAGKDELTNFLKTPLGRVAGMVGLGAFAYKFLRKIGVYRGGPPAGPAPAE